MTIRALQKLACRLKANVGTKQIHRVAATLTIRSARASRILFFDLRVSMVDSALCVLWTAHIPVLLDKYIQAIVRSPIPWFWNVGNSTWTELPNRLWSPSKEQYYVDLFLWVWPGDLAPPMGASVKVGFDQSMGYERELGKLFVHYGLLSGICGHELETD
jgi:hypothetical protein